MKELPTEVKCPKCGAEKELSLYVYAHWDTVLETQCPNGHKFHIKRGRVF